MLSLRLVRAGLSLECRPISNSSSKSAASISSAAPTVASSFPSSPPPSTTLAKNSAPPAAPIPTPSSSSKPKPKSTSPSSQRIATLPTQSLFFAVNHDLILPHVHFGQKSAQESQWRSPIFRPL